jgi:hypothetical protein
MLLSLQGSETDIFLDWFMSWFVPEVKTIKLEKSPNSKCILLLDDCGAHPPEFQLVSGCGNMCAYYLPPNITCFIQPMDQGII